jgi:motility quorum-sensing regulator/GCU-specific mRNA interferase toxin
MEKRTPHCKLTKVKDLVQSGQVRATRVAADGALSLGMSFADMVSTVLALQASDFYKSMTTHADHRVWQDVYRPMTTVGAVYLKLTVVDDVLIVSFKEL